MDIEFGTLVRWTERQFGFIRDDKTGQDFFAHVSGFKAKVALAKGTRVKFRIGTRNGNPIAVDIEPVVAPVSGSQS